MGGGGGEEVAPLHKCMCSGKIETACKECHRHTVTPDVHYICVHPGQNAN